MGDKVSTVIEKIKKTGLFNIEAGIEYCVDEEGYVEILEQCPYTFESSLRNLCGFYDKGISLEDEANITEYRVVAHSIKSTARLLGYDSLFETGKISEFAARDLDLDMIKSNHSNLVSQTKEAIEMIQGFFEESGDEDLGEVMGVEDLGKLLESLIEAADDFDIDVLDDGAKKLKNIQLPETMISLKKQLISAVANIDTDGVIEVAAEMLQMI